MKNQFIKIVTNNSQQLQKKLSEYGLCPDDWSMESKNNDYILIKNKSEQNFYFIGKTVVSKVTNELCWKYITLASL